MRKRRRIGWDLAHSPTVRIENKSNTPHLDHPLPNPLQPVSGNRILDVIRFPLEEIRRVQIPVKQSLGFCSQREPHEEPVVYMRSHFLPLNDKIRRVLLQRPLNAKNEPVPPEHVAVPSAAEVAADADGGADSGGEAVDFAAFPDLVVEFAERRAGLDDGNVVLDVDVDVAEVEEVEDDEGTEVGDVGDALIVVAAASNFDLDWDVGFVERGYDE
ncbi:uncharacterized protein G2W53_026495 [Senna tora]|uniref:Uncharacterized protein n=1 Tax=Senna tora TaxID=362788 RepID=A0A834TFT3_9FABA|nr:uncharacterized protein G2W53_026495 [Senna tora]